MNKKAKTILAYSLLAFIILVCVILLAQVVIAYTSGDSDLKIEYRLIEEGFAGRSYTPQCFVDCHLPFCVSYAGDSAALALAVNKEDIKQYFNFLVGADESRLKDYGIDYLTTETYYVDVNDYGTCEEIWTDMNDTENPVEHRYNYPCLVGSHEEQRTRQVWRPLNDISQLEFEKNREICFDIWGKLEPGLGEKFAVDVIPSIKISGKEFIMTEMAWWTGSPNDFRRKVYFNTTSTSCVRVPYRINSSAGINGNEVWAIPQECFAGATNYSMYWYYDNLSDGGAFVNFSEDTQMPHDAANGTEKSHNTSGVWIDAGAVAVWHLNGQNDSSGSGHNITWTGSPSYVAAKFAKGIDLNAASSQGGSVADHTDLKPADGTGFSISGWMKLDDIPASVYYFMEKNTGGSGGNGFRSYILSNGIIHFDVQSGGNVDLAAARPMVAGQWYHVVFTRYSNNTGTLFINGSFESSLADMVITHVADPLNIGNNDGSYYFNGVFDEIRFYNKSFTPDEAKAMYEEGASRHSELGAEETESGTATESQGDSAIQAGIASSVINATQTNYTNQQVYAVNVSGDQVLGKFDVVVASGNQRWAFNYVTAGDPTSSYTNMMNITPVLYVWEATNKTEAEITSEVQVFIDGTQEDI